MRFSDLPPAGTVVWGYGREGAAVAAELARRGLDATIALPDATDTTAAPVDAPLPVLVGAAAVEALRTARVVVASPGVPATAPLQVELAAAGTPVTGLTDLWLGEHAGVTIGVTGTKGKSTTASLIAHLARAVGLRSAVVGNVGTPVLSVDADQLDVVALEVSSYQARTVTTSPRVVVLTSLYAEHLPWHGGYAAYVHDKLNLLAHGPEHVVAAPGPAYDEAAARVDARTTLHRPDADHVHADDAGDLVWPGVGRLGADELPLPGRHNAANCALALRALEVAGLLGDEESRRTALASLRDFAPLAHRLEPVGSSDGRAWYDDSLATAPEAVVAALEVWATERVLLLFGGADRGLELAPLVAYLAGRETPVSVHAFGAAGTRLAAALPADARHPVHLSESFADAVRAVLASEDPARRVLFSPGAPSFDEYADYRDRAAALRTLLGC